MAISAVTATLISIGLTAASTAYQYTQQRKMKKKAKQAAEARKGFEIVTEAEVIALPIVYGKAKVGGTRVFHKTLSSFPGNVPSNADTEINMTTSWFHEDNTKNSYLLFQQALCQGPISSCTDVVINDDIYLNNGDIVKNKAGFIAYVHHNGGEAETVTSSLAPERINAKFPGAAYASVIIRLNRDDPLFQGVPDVSFFIEGKKVRKVENGLLSTSKAYSNNAALVLLDYLLEYRKVAIDQIDLPSFEAAADICDTVVMPNATVAGNIYKNVLGTVNISQRDVRLYETNILLDSAKSHRDNIEAILETMGDGRLVWSQGKYKLSLQYPGINNTNIILSDEINDDRLVLGNDVKIEWPSAEERYNNVSVRFNNEAENFKEDVVSWPPKVSGSYARGLGGMSYAAQSGWAASEFGRFLNNYAVWNGGDHQTTLAYKIRPTKTGTYTLKFGFSNIGSITVNNQTFNRTGSSATISAVTLSLTANTVYDIAATGVDGGGLRGIAATLTDFNNVTIWTTREPAYTGFQVFERSSNVYTEMLAEDNGVELETDMFFEGCTDYYHALAKAEEVCRTSRSAFKINFTYFFQDKYLEPGDFISFSSESLKLGSTNEIYIRVDSIKLKDNLSAEISGTRFDWTQLAWNVADNEYVRPAPSYVTEIPAPEFLEYLPSESTYENSAGSLNWPLVDDTRVLKYELFVKRLAPNSVFEHLGYAEEAPFALPALDINESYTFGVASITSLGLRSSIVESEVVGIDKEPPIPIGVSAVNYGDFQEGIRVSWTIPATRANGTEYSDHLLSEIYFNIVDDVSTATKAGEVYSENYFIHIPVEYERFFYWVRLVSSRYIKGSFSTSDEASISSYFDQLINEAQNKADTANNAVLAMSLDNKLSPVEKKVIRVEWDTRIAAEKDELVSQATLFEIETEKATYLSTWTALATYLNGGSPFVSGIPLWISDTLTIDGSKYIETTTDIIAIDFRNVVRDFYNARTALFNAAAARARSLALNAQVQANTANAAVQEMTSDNYISPVEKKTVRIEWDGLIFPEKATLQGQAAALNITTELVAYETAWQNLANYLNGGPYSTGIPFWINDVNLETSTEVVGADFRNITKLFYEARLNLHVIINTKTLLLANTAKEDAEGALNVVNEMSLDSKLTPTEKKTVRIEWDSRTASEKASLNAQADNFSITSEKTAYNDAWQALATYLNGGITWTAGVPLWISDAELANVTTISPTAYRSVTKTFYDSRTALLNAISIKLKQLADTAQGTANGAATNASNALSAVSSKLSASSSYVLTGAVTVQDTGGIKAGSIAWNSTTGEVTGGSGVVLTEYGLIGAKNGVPAFTVTNAGDATFAGNIDTDGDARFYGRNTSDLNIVIGPGAYAVDYSCMGFGNSAPISVNYVRAAVVGYAPGAVGAYVVGLLGRAANTTKGVGCAADGGFRGGYFSTSNAAGVGLLAHNTAAGGTGVALWAIGKTKLEGDASVTGNLTATGNITAYSSSDRTLKENIRPIDNALERVLSLTGAHFQWRDEFLEKNDGFRKDDVGVVAQEVQAVLPEIVVKREDGTLAVRYEKLVPLLIEAIKELSAKVDCLEART